jgi:hypothetical protein
MRQTSFNRVVGGLALVAAMTFSSTSLAAQDRGRGRERAPQGTAQPRSAPAPRAEAPRERSAAPQPAPRQSTAQPAPRQATPAPQPNVVRPRAEARVPPGTPAPSRNSTAARRAPDRRDLGSVAVPRGSVYRAPRAVITRTVRVPVVVYPRRYYTFHPRYVIGFGLYLGAPVPYPLAFGYPTYVYDPYNPYYATTVRPLPNSYGGISFDVDPGDAEVIVDGVNVGYADDFAPDRQPLTLTPGRHHIELYAPGLEPLDYDVEVYAGEVVPFQGSLY